METLLQDIEFSCANRISFYLFNWITGESIPIKSVIDCQTEGVLYKLDCMVQGCDEICYDGESIITVFCITGSCSLTSMIAAGALLVLRIVPHSARSQTLQARSFLGMLGPFLCTPCVRGQEVHSAHSIKPKICRTLSSEMFQSLTQSCKTRWTAQTKFM